MVFIDTFRARILVSNNIVMVSMPNTFLGKCLPVYTDAGNFFFMEKKNFMEKVYYFLLEVQRQKKTKLRPLP